MVWSDEVHTSRITQATIRARRQARMRKADRIPEAEGSASSDVLVAATCAVVTTILLRQKKYQRSVKTVVHNVVDSFVQFLPRPPARVRHCTTMHALQLQLNVVQREQSHGIRTVLAMARAPYNKAGSGQTWCTQPSKLQCTPSRPHVALSPLAFHCVQLPLHQTDQILSACCVQTQTRCLPTAGQDHWIR